MLDLVIPNSPRKKILTRQYLIGELEKILCDLQESPQFASLRGYPLKSFCPSDNPIFELMTLGQLATNPLDALRDSNQIDRKEIAALVEAFHLISVCSEHSLSLMTKSFSDIEQRATSVERTLQEVLTSIPSFKPSVRVTPADSNVAVLRSALSALKKSPSFEAIKNSFIEQFWDPKASSCSHLSRMTWQEIMATSPSAIFDLPNFGKSRLKYLIQSIERAQTYCQDREASDSKAYNPVRDAQNAIAKGLGEIQDCGGSYGMSLANAIRHSSQQALTTAYLSQSIIQRRVGQLIGVTESRVSQLLQECNKSLAESLSHWAADAVHQIEKSLSDAACADTGVASDLNLNKLSEDGLCLIRLLIQSLGASNPAFKGTALKDHWTKSPAQFERVMTAIIESLPLNSESVSSRLAQVMPGCQTQSIFAFLSEFAYFLKAKDRWYRTQEDALSELLKNAKEPMSAQEITDVFETGPRQMRYLLQNSKNIVRIGRNNGRKYTVL